MRNNIVIDIKRNNVESAYIQAEGFYEGKKALARQGFRVISLEEQAKLGIEEGIDSPIFREGNWVKEGVIYLSDQEIYLTKNSPLMTRGSLTTGKINQSLANSIRLPAKTPCLPGKRYSEPNTVQIKDFGNEPITKFVFGSDSKRLGQLLGDSCGFELAIYLPELTSDTRIPHFSQVYFGRFHKKPTHEYGEVLWYHGHADLGGIPLNCNYPSLASGTVRGIRGEI